MSPGFQKDSYTIQTCPACDALTLGEKEGERKGERGKKRERKRDIKEREK